MRPGCQRPVRLRTVHRHSDHRRPSTPKPYLHCAYAAHQGAVPHVHVSGITHHPQRPHTSSPSVRRVLKLLVAVRLGRKPTVCHLTGTSYEGCPALPKYLHANGTPYSKMGATEYCNHLSTVFGGAAFGGTRQLRTRPLILWHDHDTTHLAQETKAWLQQRGILEQLMPVRSPDLDPLDYGVFGTAKSSLRHHVFRDHMGWDQACRTFVAELCAMDTDATIRELPLRLQACVDVQGGHIEERLCELKRGRGKD